MRTFLFLVSAALAWAGAETTIRSVDFATFLYPCEGRASEWPSQLKWLSAVTTKRLPLKGGRWEEPNGYGKSLPFAGLTLEEVVYADITSDGREDSIVVLRFDTGGTQYYHYVYVFEMKDSLPVVSAYFRSGDRSSHGLYRVYTQRGDLVVELFDPDKRIGDCCSKGIKRQRYHWTGVRFERAGRIEKAVPKAATRSPVTIFGQPF